MIRGIMVAATMSSPFAVLFTLAASTIHSPDALQSEILALLTLTGRLLKQCAPTPVPQTLGPTVMGFVIAILVGLAPWSADRSTRDGGHRLVSESVLRYWIKHGGYFPTHNPTHKKYVLHELPRTLAVPAVL
jgi:hypothetical protein